MKSVVPRLLGAVTVAGLLAVVVAGCGSPPAAQQADEICAGVAERVAALEDVTRYSLPMEKVLPVLDAQLAIAGEGRAALAGITPEADEQPKHGALLATWEDVVRRLEAFRTVRVQYPIALPGQSDGEANIASITIYAAAQDAERLITELSSVAPRSDAPRCGTIRWTGVYLRAR